MTQQLFGQFLLERGKITRAQLIAGLKRQRERTPLLGDLAVDAGWLSASQAQRINLLQRNHDEQFGVLCLREGLLNEEQLTELLDQQKAKRRSLGMALVELGHLSHDEVEAELKAQAAEEGPGPAKLPSFVLERPSDTEIARHAVRVVSTQYLRLTQEPLGFVRISPPGGTDISGRIIVSQKLQVAEQYEVLIALTEEVGNQIASRYLEEERSFPDPLCVDAVSEFLNIIVGHILAHIAPVGAEVKAEPPRVITDASDLDVGRIFFHGVFDAAGIEVDLRLSRA